jgi:preprotein translocase subunit SecA
MKPSNSTARQAEKDSQKGRITRLQAEEKTGRSKFLTCLILFSNPPLCYNNFFERITMFQKIMKLVGGNPNKREVERLTDLILPVNDFELQYEKLSDEELRAKTGEFRTRLAAELVGIEDLTERQTVEQSVLDELMPEAFAAVREASKRSLGLRHYDVQLIGGAALHFKNISEMRTGEGKTLVATLPLYLNALTGTHLPGSRTVGWHLAIRQFHRKW